MVIELRSLAAVPVAIHPCARDTKAGASYCVSDLEALAQDTHKFESRYLDRLVGPTLNGVTSTGSAHPFISRIASPSDFLPGLEDKIVLPNQAEMMVSALKAKVAWHMSPCEHGFRRAENIKRALDGNFTLLRVV